MRPYTALSIVTPHGANIAAGCKSVEVRSWRPQQLPILDLLIVENERFLTQEGEVDPNGKAVELVDVHEVHAWQPSEVEAACASSRSPGYWAWRLENVRPIVRRPGVSAERKLYSVQLNEALLKLGM